MKTIWGHVAKKREAYPSEIKRDKPILCRNCPQIEREQMLFLNWKPTLRPSGHVRTFCSSCEVPVWVKASEWHLVKSRG